MIFDEIYGKKVIAVDTAEELGRIDGIYIEKDSFEYAGLSVAGPGARTLSLEDALGKEDFVTVASASALSSPKKNYWKLYKGQKALTRGGREIGEITDIVFGRKYLKLVVGETILPPYKIESASEGYLLVNLRSAKPSASESESEEDFKGSDSSVSDSLTNENNDADPFQEITLSNPGEPQNPIESVFSKMQSPSVSQAQFEEFVVTAAAPLRFQQLPQESLAPDYSFLLGRKVEREITDLTRTFFVSVGTIINDKVLANAKKAGKIVDLAINSSKK